MNLGFTHKLNPQLVNLILEKTGQKDIAQAIKQLCDRELERSNNDRLPIHLNPICKQLGIVQVTKAKAIHFQTAKLRYLNNKGYEVIYRPTYWRRDRFSIAHEIVHIIIHKALAETGWKSNTKHQAFWNSLEAICNFGAGYLLLPDELLWSSILENGLISVGMRHLYDNSLMSQSAMFLRITETIPYSGIVQWTKYKKSSTDQYDFRVVGNWTASREKGKFWGVPKGCSTKYLSPAFIDPTDDAGQYKRICENFSINTSTPLDGLYGVLSQHFLKTRTQLPLFENHPIPDEESNSSDRILFFFHKSKLQQVDSQKFNTLQNIIATR